MNKAFIVHTNIDSELSNKSMITREFGETNFVMTLDDSNILNVGLYKPFDFFFVQLSNAVNTDANVEFMYWSTGEDWKSLKVLDETFSFSKSGFVVFQKPEDWAESTINGEKGYYIRTVVAEGKVDFNCHGVGIVFSNDSDIKEEKTDILNSYNEDTLILKHQAARKTIVQEVRSWGETKSVDGINVEDITEFDLKLDQVRQASKYLVLAKIYQNDLSQMPDDSYFQTGKGHYSFYKSSLRKNLVCIDRNDNGKDDYEDRRAKVGSKSF